MLKKANMAMPRDGDEGKGKIKNYYHATVIDFLITFDPLSARFSCTAQGFCVCFELLWNASTVCMPNLLKFAQICSNFLVIA